MNRKMQAKLAAGVAVVAILAMLPSAVGHASAPLAITNHIVSWDSADWGFGFDSGTSGTWGYQNGPGTAPAGTGSAHVTLGDSTTGIILGTQKYLGTKLSDIQSLSYSTYTNLSPAAMTFQINYDPDVTTIESGTWYGRLTYEPYFNGTVNNGVWQSWDMISSGGGMWWASPNGPSPVDDICSQGSPCSWSTLIATWPNIGIRNDGMSGIGVKAGSSWNGFDGNADKLSIQIGGNTDVYDFEAPNTVYVDATWTGSSVGVDPDGAGPAHYFGGSGDAFDKVADGVAAVRAGGTVQVASGTYNEALISIGKALTLQGAGSATTVIDGGGVAAAGQAGMIKISHTTGPVSVSGFTLQNAGGDLAGTISLILVDHNSVAAPVTIEDNVLKGRGNGDLFDMGLWSYSTDGGLTIQNNEIRDMWQGLLLERPRGGASVLTNNFHDLLPANDGSTLYEAEGIFAFTYSADHVSNKMAVNGNTFAGYNGSAIAFGGGYPAHTAAHFTDVEIKNNTINAIGSGPERRHVGIYLINWGSTPSDAANGGVVNGVISGNTITTGGTGSIGIWLSGPQPGLTISQNYITDLESGILTDEKYTGAGFPQGIAAYGNSFTGNTTAVVNGSSAGADIFNASGNWWGCNGGPAAVGCDPVSANVDYTPWLDAGTDGSGDPGFQGDFSVLDVDAVSPQSGTTGRITEAIDMVSGSTVNVAAGTYVENVVINNPVELIGAGQGASIVMPAVSNPNCGDNNIGSSLCSGSSNIMLVQADDVTIHGFTLEGNNPDLTSGQVFGGEDIDARNGIITNHNAGTYNGLEVYDVTVQNIFLRGMYDSTGSFNIHDNIVTNVQATYYSIAMFAWYGPGTFENNTVSYANDAISANHSKGIDFLNNTVTHSLSGVHTDNSNDGGGVTDLIQGNTVSDCGPEGYGIFVFVPYKAPRVNNNTITNCQYGLSEWGQAPGAVVTTRFTNNTVTGPSQATGSVGVYLTTDQIGYGYNDIAVQFTGNVITGFETGVYLTADQPSWEPGPWVSKTITASFQCNDIAGNLTGATKGLTGTILDDMTYNWWGAANGPSGDGPGSGDPVTGGIHYSPWATEPGCGGVPPYVTSTTITGHTPEPSVELGDVTINFTVIDVIDGGPVPVGTVDVLDGDTVICNDAALDGSGNGSCTYAFPTNGIQALTAKFNPTDLSQFTTSQGMANHTVAASLTITSGGWADGWVLESGEFTNLGGTKNSTGKMLKVGDDALNRQYRSILAFKTGLLLPDNANVLGATLEFKKAGIVGSNPFTSLGKLRVDIKKGSFGSASKLQLSDFSTLASANSILLYSDSSSWFSLPLHSSDLQYVNLVGPTQFRLRFATDDNNNLVADFLKLYSGNAGTANRPKLTVLYYIPAP